MKLNKNKVYDLSELTIDELEQVFNFLRTEDEDWHVLTFKNFKEGLDYARLAYVDNEWIWVYQEPTANAKELFYTLENIQVDCRNLTEGQIKEMIDIFESKGYCYFENDKEFSLSIIADTSYLHIYEGEIIIDSMVEGLKEITYDKFMELFGEVVDEHTKEFIPSKKQVLKYLLKKDIILTPKQYKKLWKGL